MTRVEQIVQAVKVLTLGVGKYGVYVDDERFDVEIRAAKSMPSPCWDQVTINGAECGNRSGAVSWLMVALGETMPREERYAFVFRSALAHRYSRERGAEVKGREALSLWRTRAA